MLRRASIRRWPLLLAPFLLLTAADCPNGTEDTGEGEDRDPPAPETRVTEPPDTLEGVVRAVGADPFVRTVVHPEGDEAVDLEGPLREEIARLVGARVRVIGELDHGGMRPTLGIVGYEILTIDGEAVEAGVLERTEEGWDLIDDDGDRARLSEPVPGSLRDRSGCKVWVQRGDEGTVRRHGVIRCP